MRKIAVILGKSPSSISREIQRNRTRRSPKQKPDNPYWYNHWRADILSKLRKRNPSNAKSVLLPGNPVYEYVVEKLQKFWSPEQISNRLCLDHPGVIVGTTTIYRHLKHGTLQNVSSKKHLRRRGKRNFARSSITIPFAQTERFLICRKRS